MRLLWGPTIPSFTPALLPLWCGFGRGVMGDEFVIDGMGGTSGTERLREGGSENYELRVTNSLPTGIANSFDREVFSQTLT